ncbi:MAG: TolC family protein [Nitrospirota bacterium]
MSEENLFRAGLKRLIVAATIIAVLFNLPAYCETGKKRQAEPAASQILTIDQAVSMAKTGSRAMKNAWLEVQKTEDTLKAAKTAFFPSIEFTASVTRILKDMNFNLISDAFPGSQSYLGDSSTTAVTIPADTDVSGAVKIVQPLSQLYRISMEVEIERKTHEIAAERQRQTRQDIVNGVKKLYYELVQSESSLTAIGEAIAFYRELARLLDDQLRQETVLRYEVLEVKAQLAKYEYDEMTIINTIITMKEQMNELLAREISTPFEVVAVPEPEIVLKEEDFSESTMRALKERPDVRMSELTAQQAEFAKKSKASEYIPDLSLAFSYHTLSNLSVGFTFASVVLTWKQPDWGKTWHELAARKRALQQAENDIEAAREKAVVDINKTKRKFAETRKLLDVRRLNRESVQDKLSTSLNMYKAGSILLKDLLKDQAAMAEADRLCHEAHGAYFSARADLDKALSEE